ncbi:MAG TPA: competence/damage-inducible protein A [Candidatus Methylomirabilis sp.]|nr:competence/damage-inducible protein A [Candidatus Methylomirabilis sp.]
MAKTAGILIIGSEVLSGKVTDQNSPYLVRELRELGVEVQRISTVPDDVRVIAHDVREYAGQFDLLFTTGGIGPTHDDVTIDAVAAAFDRRVVRHPVLERALRRHYGPDLTSAQLKMAEIPEGGRLAGEDNLSFPVLVFRNVYIFPGIPEVLRKKFECIREQFRELPYILRRVFLHGDEGRIAGDLHAVLDRYPALQLGSYPILHNPDHNVMLTLESKDASYVEQALRYLLERLPPQIVIRVE